MTPQTAQQWLNQAAMIQCDRYHARITIASCQAFQNRHDSEQNGNWKHGIYSKYPHPCEGCEHFTPHESRSAALKSRRIAPSLPIPTGETRIRQKTTVICPVCHEKREVTVDRTTQPSFISSGGMCRSCGRREKNKSKPKRLDPRRKVPVTCPVCGNTREVSWHLTRREGYTGRCGSCAVTEMNKQRGVSREGWKERVDVTCPKCKRVRQVQYGFTVRKDFTGFCSRCAQKAKKHYKKDWRSK